MNKRLEHQTAGETREASKALTAWGLGLAIAALILAVTHAWGLFPLAIAVVAIVLAVVGAIRNPAMRGVSSAAAIVAAIAGALTGLHG